MSHYVAAYDISDTSRRCRVVLVLERYGQRVQRSVFEVWIRTEELGEFKRAIGPLLTPDDEFDLFPIDGRPNCHRIRWQRDPVTRQAVILL